MLHLRYEVSYKSIKRSQNITYKATPTDEQGSKSVVYKSLLFVVHIAYPYNIFIVKILVFRLL